MLGETKDGEARSLGKDFTEEVKFTLGPKELLGAIRGNDKAHLDDHKSMCKSQGW